MALAKARILLVEDDATIRAAVASFLRVHGLEVDAAASCAAAEEAFRAIERPRPVPPGRRVNSGSNARRSASSLNPPPESRTVHTTHGAASVDPQSTSTTTSASGGECWTAFWMTFWRTRVRRPRSISTGGTPPAQRLTTFTPAARARGWHSRMAS